MIEAELIAASDSVTKYVLAAFMEYLKIVSANSRLTGCTGNMQYVFM
jgi:hypothetical protein